MSDLIQKIHQTPLFTSELGLAIKQLCGGRYFTIALLEDGSVKFWGWRPNDDPLPDCEFIQLDCATNDWSGITPDGDLVSVGPYGITVLSGNYVDLCVADNLILALDDAGQVWGNFGGDGLSLDLHAPDVPLKSITDTFCRNRYSYRSQTLAVAITSDEKAIAWEPNLKSGSSRTKSRKPSGHIIETPDNDSGVRKVIISGTYAESLVLLHNDGNITFVADDENEIDRTLTQSFPLTGNREHTFIDICQIGHLIDSSFRIYLTGFLDDTGRVRVLDTSSYWKSNSDRDPCIPPLVANLPDHLRAVAIGKGFDHLPVITEHRAIKDGIVNPNRRATAKIKREPVISGDIWAFGDNRSGKCSFAGSSVKTAACRYGSVTAVAADGKPMIFPEWLGMDEDQLFTKTRSFPSNCVQFQAGVRQWVALDSNGTTKSQGSKKAIESDMGYWSEPDPNWGLIQITSGMHFFAALRADGEIAVWGKESMIGWEDQLNEINGNCIAIDAGKAFLIGLDANGLVAISHDHKFILDYRLGIAKSREMLLESATPEEREKIRETWRASDAWKSRRFTQVSAGLTHAAAIDAQGYLHYWLNTYEESRHDGWRSLCRHPDQIYQHVSCGTGVTAGTTIHGKVYVWGADPFEEPVEVGVSDGPHQAAFIGDRYLALLTTNNELMMYRHGGPVLGEDEYLGHFPRMSASDFGHDGYMGDGVYFGGGP